jgi:hypothetical membrane protein
MLTERKTRIYVNTSLILGLVAILFFIVSTFTIMFLVEDHDFIRDVISVTGHDNPYAWLFNLTLIVSGILMIPGFPAIYLVMKKLDDSRPKLLLTITILGTLIGPFVSLAGVFNEGDHFIAHIVFAVGAYTFVIFAAFLWGIFIWKVDENHPYKSNKIWYLDISVNFIIVACMLAYIIAMSFFQDFIWDTLGILEKITIYAFFIYFIIIIIRVLIIHNGKRQNVS